MDRTKSKYEKAINLTGSDNPKKIEKGLSIMRELSQSGYPPALTFMGDYYESISNDYQETARLYKQAADKGDGNGARCYADMLMTGNGVDQNREEAFKYYTIAADAGIPEAAFVIGEFLRSAGDKEGAIQAYKKAADNGYELAKARIKQLIEQNSPEESLQGSREAGENTFMDHEDFLNKCIDEFGRAATNAGYMKNIVFIPELVPMGEKVVLSFLQDNFFQMEFGDNPLQYYYVINTLCLQAGVVAADMWHQDFDKLKGGFLDEIIAKGPAEYAKPIFQKEFELDSDGDAGEKLYSKVFEKWIELHQPAWELDDPRDYTFAAIHASYLTGVSMILSKYGY